MGMSHLSLTCRLSHILYCPVLSLCHLSFHSTCSGWEWTISRSPVVCHIDCTVMCCHHFICVIILQALDRNEPYLAHLQFVTLIVLSYVVIMPSVCSLCRQWMGMSNISLTCSLSHRLYCHVLSLCHLCVFILRQWMGMNHISLTCRLSHILYCPVLSLCHLCVHSAGSGWEWIISLPLAVCHMYCIVLFRCLTHGVVVVCFSRYQAVDGRVLHRVIIGCRVFEVFVCQ